MKLGLEEPLVLSGVRQNKGQPALTTQPGEWFPEPREGTAVIKDNSGKIPGEGKVTALAGWEEAGGRGPGWVGTPQGPRCQNTLPGSGLPRNFI